MNGSSLASHIILSSSNTGMSRSKKLGINNISIFNTRQYQVGRIPQWRALQVLYTPTVHQSQIRNFQSQLQTGSPRRTTWCRSGRNTAVLSASGTSQFLTELSVFFYNNPSILNCSSSMISILVDVPKPSRTGQGAWGRVCNSFFTRACFHWYW